MTDLIIVFMLAVFIIVGLARPNVAVMGYIWIDIVVPQKLAFGFISGAPLSMIMGVVCLLSLVVNVNKLNRLRRKKITVLLVLFAFWITVTTVFASYPTAAWTKWDWAFKTVMAGAIIPFAINDKRELEGLIWVFLASIAFYTISGGAKTVLGGGGYGSRLIAGADNSGISESSTLALAATVSLPLFLNFLRNSILMTPTRWYRLFLIALIVSAVSTVVGSYARTGLIGLVAFAFIKMGASKHKIKVAVLLLVASVLVFSFAPKTWLERMQTTQNATEESSALGRIAVWRWTLDFAASNPLGGGFGAYRANRGLLDLYHDNPNIVFGRRTKAFHSVYFEVLGEHGYIGLLLYLAIMGLAYRELRRLAKTTKDDWTRNLAIALKHSLILFAVTGSFVGVAFQPILFLVVVFSIALSNLRPTKCEYSANSTT